MTRIKSLGQSGKQTEQKIKYDKKTELDRR